MTSGPTVMVITGATSGIGEAAATALAGEARIGIVARSAQRAQETMVRIRQVHPDAQIDVFLGDLALMADVRNVAAAILEHYARIDVLINNAGVQLLEQRVTSEGLPEMIAVNYLAPWLLTALLRDRLIASSPARVVMTASEGHRLGWSVDPDTILTDTTAFRGVLAAYGKSKLLDVLFTLELADRLRGTGVTANCCCPGLVATNLGGSDTRAHDIAMKLSHTPLVRRADQGARVLVRLATDPAYAVDTGRFVTSTPGARLLPTIPAVRDRGLRRRLWTTTAALLGAP